MTTPPERQSWPLRLPDAPLWYVPGSAERGEPQYAPDEANEARYQAAQARRWEQLPLPMDAAA